MKKKALMWAVLCLIPALLAAAQKPGTRGSDVREALFSGLRQPEQFSEAVFSWENAPGWIIKDVVFGVRDGALVFAKFTTIPPGGKPSFIDKSSQVDYLIDDTANLREPVRMKIGDGREILVDQFTIGIRATGDAVIDTVSGADLKGEPFSYNVSRRGSKIQVQPAGLCGAAQVRGTCNDFCYGSCAGDVSSGDPCVCQGTGGCTTGTAKWVCPTGTCAGFCEFHSGSGCGCFPLAVDPVEEPVGTETSNQ